MQPNTYVTRPLRVVGAWPEPAPLFDPAEQSTPYPVNVLPPLLRDAVIEQQEFGQQPVELVACSGLSALSLAAQGLADVARDDDLIGPISLSFLTVANSGERKSSADKRMSKAVRGWERRREEELAADAAKSRSDVATWEAKKEGLKSKIRAAVGGADPGESARLERDYAEMEANPPAKVILPAMFYEDATQEGIAKYFASGWPSASLWSDEGGIVVGGHGMEDKSAMRFFGFLNRLWDGNAFPVRRSTADPIKIVGRRMTAHLMMQACVMTQLLGAGNGAARGTGFLARYLIAWPKSTMGTRAYKPRPASGQALALFDRRLEQLLDYPLPAEGALMELKPPVLRLTPEAHAAWVDMHDLIEGQIGPGGEYADVADFASKAGENAARLAGVFHIFDHGPTGDIGADTFKRAAAVVSWHLAEARRIMSAMKKPEVISDAEALLAWLIGRGGEVAFADMSSGARRFRGRKKERDAALAVLEETGSVRVWAVSETRTVSVNPKLMEES